ncbi:MAG: hypothetical protein HY593_00725, partial [Candidatus Omnitrophica bacterium]|nr:hypothetical protein [Candidatus Omnitrophota bacterium]
TQTFSMLNNAALQDAVIQTKIKMDGSGFVLANQTLPEEAYLYFRMSPDNKFGYAAKIETSKLSDLHRLRLYRIDDGVYNQIGNAVDLAALIPGYDPAQVHTLKVDFRGELIKVSIDNKNDVIVQKDFAYSGAGYTDAALGTNNTSARVWFEDLTVSDVPHSRDSLTRQPVPPAVPASGQWVVADDGAGTQNTAYAQTRIGGGDDLTVFNNVTLSDGTIQAKIRIDETASGALANEAYVYFRLSSDRKTGYAAMLDRNKRLTLNVVENNFVLPMSDAVDLLSLIPNYNPAQYHTLKVDLRGEIIKVSIDNKNDVLVRKDFTYSGSSNTAVALGTNQTSAPVWFDDVTFSSVLHSRDSFTQVPVPPATPASGRWAVQDDGTGNIAYVQTKNQFDQALSVLNGAALLDGVLQVRVRVEGTGFFENQASVLFRLSSNRQEGYEVRVDNKKQIVLYRIGGGAPLTLGGPVDLSALISNYDPAQYHALKIDLKGELIKIFVDDTEALVRKDFTYNDSNHKAVALATYKTSGPVWFDDVTLSGIPHSRDSFTKFPAAPATPLKGVWVVADDGTGNAAYAQVGSGGMDYQISMWDNIFLENGTVQARVRIEGIGGIQQEKDEAYVYFRLSADGLYGYAAAAARDKKLRFYRVDNGLRTELGDAVDLSVLIENYDPMEYHTLKIDFRNEIIKVSVDNKTDVLVRRDFTYSGSNHTSVALGTFHTSAPVWFDDVAVMDILRRADSFTEVPATPHIPASGFWEAAGAGTARQLSTAFGSDNLSRFMMNQSLLADGTVETKVTFDDTGSLALLFFRTLDSQDGYAVQLDGGGNLALTTVKGGAVSEVLEAGGLEGIGLGQWQKIKVTLAGSAIKVFIGVNEGDYVEQLSVTDSTFTTGKLGIGTAETMGPVSFGDLVTSSGTFSPSAILSAIPRGTLVPFRGIWRYANDGAGHIAHSQQRFSSGYNVSILHETLLDDGVIEVKVKIDGIGAEKTDEALIRFRMTPDGKFGYAAGLDKSKGLVLYRIDNGVYTSIGSVPDLSALIPGYVPSQYHTLKVELQNELIRISVDDKADALVRSDFHYYGSDTNGISLATNDLSAPAWFRDVSTTARRGVLKESFRIFAYASFVPMSGTWVVEGGQYKQTQKFPNDTGLNRFQTSLHNGVDRFTNGKISSDIVLNNDGTANEPGAVLFFRMDGDGNGYAAEVKKTAVSLYKISRNFTTLELLAAQNLSTNLQYGQTYRLEVDTDGSRLTARVQGGEATANDNAYLSGKIWLVLHTPRAGQVPSRSTTFPSALRVSV